MKPQRECNDNPKQGRDICTYEIDNKLLLRICNKLQDNENQQLSSIMGKTDTTQ